MAAQLVGPFDDELFLACMKRFLYISCYSSIQFLSALKVSTNILNGTFEDPANDILLNHIVLHLDDMPANSLSS